MRDRHEVLSRLGPAARREPDRPLPERFVPRVRRDPGRARRGDHGGVRRPSELVISATDRQAAQLETLYDLWGEGPGPDAFFTGQVVVAALDHAEDHRWPMSHPRQSKLWARSPFVRCRCVWRIG